MVITLHACAPLPSGILRLYFSIATVRVPLVMDARVRVFALLAVRANLGGGILENQREFDKINPVSEVH